MQIKLSDSNGLYTMLAKYVEPNIFSVYFETDLGRVIVYWNTLKQGITIEQLRLKVAQYIGNHMLQDSYKQVEFIRMFMPAKPQEQVEQTGCKQEQVKVVRKKEFHINKSSNLAEIYSLFTEGVVAVAWDTNKKYPLTMVTYDAELKDDNGYNRSVGIFGNMLIGFRRGGYRNIYLIDKTVLSKIKSKKRENQYLQIRRKAHTKIVWQVVK